MSIEFKWEGDNLIISQCGKMKSDPKACDTCEQRFKCFTIRVKPNGAVINSHNIPKLSDLLKALETNFGSE